MMELAVEATTGDEMAEPRTVAPRLEPSFPSVPDEGISLVSDDDGVVAVVMPAPDRLRAELMRAIKLMGERVFAASSLRQGGIRNRAQVFGTLSGSPILRRYACRVTPTPSSPEIVEALLALERTSGVLAEMASGLIPEQIAVNAEALRDTDAAWIMPGGLWTSGILNLSSAMPYHYDRNNVRGSWSAMVVARRFMNGGHLHLPGLGLPTGPRSCCRATKGTLRFLKARVGCMASPRSNHADRTVTAIRRFSISRAKPRSASLRGQSWTWRECELRTRKYEQRLELACDPFANNRHLLSGQTRGLQPVDRGNVAGWGYRAGADHGICP